jgi:excisionase family DNA binding protein
MSTEINIDGPVSDGVPLPFQVVIQPVLTFFKPIQAPAAQVDGYLTAEQAANYLGVHVETLRKWVRLGTFPSIPLPGSGKDYRFTKELIDEWAKQRALGTKRK